MAEFSHIIHLDKDRKFEITANEKECEALAKRFEWDTIREFKGQFALTSEKNSWVLSGTISAEIINQSNKSSVIETINLHIVKHEKDFERFNILEDVELAKDNSIDLGEIMSQYLYLKVTNGSQ